MGGIEIKCTFENFADLKINGALIALESIQYMYPYWCYPLNASPIGLEGSVLYCFIDGYGETVFVSNPESCVDSNVYPLARSFEDFIRLILACGSANPVEQIVWMNKTQFDEHLKAEALIRTEEQLSVLEAVKNAFGLVPMENPYEYVKEIQNGFDYSKIQYSDEYYDVLGIERY